MPSMMSWARRLASAKREPSASVAFMLAETSSTMTVLFPPRREARKKGAARPATRQASAASCKKRRRLRRSFWKGAFAWTSWTARRQRKTEGTTRSRRRSLRR
jgi:hypothetical protein